MTGDKNRRTGGWVGWDSKGDFYFSLDPQMYINKRKRQDFVYFENFACDVDFFKSRNLEIL